MNRIIRALQAVSEIHSKSTVGMFTIRKAVFFNADHGNAENE